MEYRIIRSDELYHYGVPGMRWGHRKSPTSLAGTGHRVLAGVYGINQRFYSKNNRNKTLASMNAAARNQQLKKAAAADAAKASKAKSARGAKVVKAKSAVNSKTSYKESLKGKASKLGAKVVGKSYKINESVERKKSAVASKVGLKKVAQTHANNADYYRKTSKDLQSGKVGKPSNRYQKAMQALGRSKYATHAIKNSKYLDTQGKAQALAEQGLLREDYRRRKTTSNVSRKTKNAATKDYKKAYASKEKELYVKNGKALEKAKGDNYYKLVDSIQDQSSKHARDYIKKKYNLTVDDINRGKTRIPGRMNTGK